MCLVLHNGSSVILQANLLKCLVNSNLYYYRTTNLFIILILYVDDLFIIGNDEQGVANFKSQLMAHFCMIDLGLVWKYRGIKLKCTKSGLLLHQMSYVDNLLHEFHMIDSTSTHVPIHESTCYDVTPTPKQSMLWFTNAW